MNVSKQDIEKFIRFQRNEITESIVYERLASIEKDENNRKVLHQIAVEEKSHYEILKKYIETIKYFSPFSKHKSSKKRIQKLFNITLTMYNMYFVYISIF